MGEWYRLRSQLFWYRAVGIYHCIYTNCYPCPVPQLRSMLLHNFMGAEAKRGGGPCRSVCQAKQELSPLTRTHCVGREIWWFFAICCPFFDLVWSIMMVKIVRTRN